jgi:hypothetical protein
MSDRERCVGCELSLTPEVSIEALGELRIVLAELSHLAAPNTIRTSRTPVRGVRKDAEEKAGDQLELGLTAAFVGASFPKQVRPRPSSCSRNYYSWWRRSGPRTRRRTMHGSHKIAAQHLTRPAVVYVRRSTLDQVAIIMKVGAVSINLPNRREDTVGRMCRLPH